MSKETQGEYFDNIPIIDIINRDDFARLEVFKTTTTEYWEITLEGKQERTSFVTIFGQTVPTKLYKVYKLKQ